MAKKDNKKIKQNLLQLVKERKLLKQELKGLDDYKQRLEEIKQKDNGKT